MVGSSFASWVPRSTEGYHKLRLSSQNALAVVYRAGIGLAQQKFAGEFQGDKNRFASHLKENGGFYAYALRLGYQAIGKIMGRAPKKMPLADRLEFNSVCSMEGYRRSETGGVIGDLSLSISPKVEVRNNPNLEPGLVETIDIAKAAIEANYRESKPFDFLEDNPLSKTESPDIHKFQAEVAEHIAHLKEKYMPQLIRDLEQHCQGKKIGQEIKHIVLSGMGGNEMYLKDVVELINGNPNSKVMLHIALTPTQLQNLPGEVTSDNTLFIATSRSGKTQETALTEQFVRQWKRFQYGLVFANGGPVRSVGQAANWVIRDNPKVDLPNDTPGRLMWTKALVLTVPLLLAGAELKKKGELEINNTVTDGYLKAMIAYSEKDHPVGEDETVWNAAATANLMIGTFRIPEILLISNNRIVDQAFRVGLQHFNESVGGMGHPLVGGLTRMRTPGMRIEPFAHAGIEGVMRDAMINAVLPIFVFDKEISSEGGLTADIADDPNHIGITPSAADAAFAYANYLKIAYRIGTPHLKIEMQGANSYNMATLDFALTKFCYNLVAMMGYNTGSNPEVALVRDDTAALITIAAQALRANNPVFGALDDYGKKLAG